MSTRCTIACGDRNGIEFHLYIDFADFVQEGGRRAIYLRLSGNDLEFKSSPDEVIVSIPSAIWDTIRKHAPGENLDGL